MEILYGTQQLLGMKREENEFMTLSSACHGDVNWYILPFFVKNKNNKKELYLQFFMLYMSMFQCLGAKVFLQTHQSIRRGKKCRSFGRRM
jgi:hypothetical protein